jgi:hypothetical protein
MSDSKSTAPLILPAGKVTEGDIPLELMQPSLRPRLSGMVHGRHIKNERKEIRPLNFSLVPPLTETNTKIVSIF